MSGKRNAEAVRDLWTFFPWAAVAAEVDMLLSSLLSVCCCIIVVEEREKLLDVVVVFG